MAFRPPDLAEDLPLPPGATLLGSALYHREGRRTHLEAILDAAGDPAAVARAYETQLHGLGWEVVERAPGPAGGGFLPGPRIDGVMLRRGGRGPVLVFGAMAHNGGPADLRVRLDWEMPRHLDNPGRHPGRPPGLERMPSLHPPAGISLKPRGGGGGGDSWYSQAVVETDRSVADLEAHFATQLAAAGWSRVNGRADEVVGWSSWRLPGEGDWRGLLLVLAAFGSMQRSLQLSIEAGEPNDDDTSSFYRVHGG